VTIIGLTSSGIAVAKSWLLVAPPAPEDALDEAELAVTLELVAVLVPELAVTLVPPLPPAPPAPPAPVVEALALVALVLLALPVVEALPLVLLPPSPVLVLEVPSPALPQLETAATPRRPMIQSPRETSAPCSMRTRITGRPIGVNLHPGIEPWAPIRPSAAFWSDALGERLLRYEDVRRAESPADAILEFVESSYRAGAELAGWDTARLERVTERAA
jgi:Family of unknown function (DUF5996)